MRNDVIVQGMVRAGGLITLVKQTANDNLRTILSSGCKYVCNTAGTRGSLGHAGKDDCKGSYPDLGSISQEPELSSPTELEAEIRPFPRKWKIDGVSHIGRHFPSTLNFN